MKKFLPLFIIFLLFALNCSSTQKVRTSSFDLRNQNFVVFPLQIEPPAQTGASAAAAILQKALANQITSSGNKLIKSDALSAKLSAMKLNPSTLSSEQIVNVGRALNANIAITGLLDYRVGPKSQKTEPNFQIKLNAFDLKTGNEIWQKETGRQFNWASDSETIAQNIANSFLKEIVF